MSNGPTTTCRPSGTAGWVRVGYLYAVGHGAGVIQGLGRAPVDFIDPVLYAQHDAADPQLFGE